MDSRYLKYRDVDLQNLWYDRKSKVFYRGIWIPDRHHHPRWILCRDVEVDAYTGLGICKEDRNRIKMEENSNVFPCMAPVVKETDTAGKSGLEEEKILTGRPAEIMEGSENAYITGNMEHGNRGFGKMDGTGSR